MMEKCSDALEDAGYPRVSSKNTILKDLRNIERDFPEAHIVQRRSSRYTYYEYEDKSFSIYNIPLNDDEMSKLTQTIAVLSKFEGLPNFDWVNDLIEHFKSSLNIQSTKNAVVAFDDNTELHNRGYFAQLFSAIVSEQSLDITYKPFSKDPKVYHFHPYFLKQYNNRWFLFGCVDGYDSLSNFPLDRIEKISNSDIPYKKNSKFDFSEIFKNCIGVSHLFDEPQIIKISISENLFPYIETKPIHHTQKLIVNENSKKIIEIFAIPNRELKSLIMSYGSDVSVLEPEPFRQVFFEEAKKTLKKYQCVHID